MNLDTATIEFMLEKLAEAGHLSACIDVMLNSTGAHYIMAKRMSVKSWMDGRESNPSKSRFVPETFSFEKPCWEVIWDYLPEQISARVVEFFEEQRCDAGGI